MPVLPIFVICGLIASVFLLLIFGRWLGSRRLRLHQQARITDPTILASVFGLMGLLIGFTFYGAGERLDLRRNLIVEEANAIGTAYLRLDLLPPDAQPELREDFRSYVRSRLAVYQQMPDAKAVQDALDRSSTVQLKIWKAATEAAKNVGPAEKALLLASLNEMIDITTTRTVALIMHPPAAVYLLLAVAVITSSLLAGYAMAGSRVRDWVGAVTFALLLGSALYVILDYEFPRIGLIRVDPLDQVLVDTLKKME
jgi:hypothetical protein